jgi:hypothetical protein
MPDCRRRYRGDFLLAPRLNHNVCHAILQLRRKHWAIPVKVVGLLTQLLLINSRIHITDVPAKPLDACLAYHLVPKNSGMTDRLDEVGACTKNQISKSGLTTFPQLPPPPGRGSLAAFLPSWLRICAVREWVFAA